MQHYTETFEKWITNNGLDAKTRAELEELQPKNNDSYEEKTARSNKKEEYFKELLKFGTGGIRGIMRPGPNGMNVYTVRQATQAIAKIINGGELTGKKSVVIAFDSRNSSELFAREAAKVFAANGIKVYIFDDIRPTPELSFAVRELECAAGVNITASHNPKEYSGYKVYGEDGGQLSLEYSEFVENEMKKIDVFSDDIEKGVQICNFAKAVKEGSIEIIGKTKTKTNNREIAIDDKYIASVMKQSVRPDEIKNADDNFKIVYTPLHGTGVRLVPEVLRRRGLKQENLILVDEQMVIDGSFPTVKKPNPEEKEVFEMAIKLAKENNCPLIIGTDPDADRVGTAVRTESGEFATLTGNQIGALLLDYIIKNKKGIDRKKDCVIKTIVTTEFARRICEHKDNNIQIMDVLTGFKFIGEKIKDFEKSKKKNFLFGFEESYGYLAGTYTRDKDAVAASMLIAEMAAYYHNSGMTLYEAMEALYIKYGKYYGEFSENVELNGKDWKEQMEKIMADLRKNLPKTIGEYKIAEIRDYKTSKITNLKTGESRDIELPKENVLYFDLENGSKVVVRPSGTEPKIKIYYLVSADEKKYVETQSEALKSAMKSIVGNPH